MLTVAVEGLAGAGKTTAIALMTDYLRSRGFRVETVDTETGGCSLLRKIARPFPNIHPIRNIIFLIIRILQYRAMVRAMKRADIVFIDQFWGSTLAIQGYGVGIPRKILDLVGQCIRKQPDITLFFDIPLEVARQRKKAKTTADMAFAERVQRGYKELANTLSWIRVDATQPPKEVKRQCLEVVLKAIET